MKKIVPFITAAGLLVLLGVAIYMLFFRSEEPALTADPGNVFGGAGDYTGDRGDSDAATDGSVPPVAEVATGLIRIAEGPVAYGVGFAEKTETRTEPSGAGTTTTSVSERRLLVRYAERASGNIYEYAPHDRSITRISNRTLPGIREAVWTRDGEVALLRFLSETEDGALVEETYALPVLRPEDGYFLEPGLDSVIVSGTSTLVTFLPNSSGGVATAAGADGSAPRTVFTSLLSSLRLLPAGANFATYTKASSELPGYGFLIDGKTGAFTRIAGPARGLTLLPSPSGKAVLVSVREGNAIKAFILDAATRAETAVPIAALPEKCAWASDEQSIYCAVPRTVGTLWPDLWYQGAAAFSDRIWEIDLEARVASLVVDPVAVADTEIDAVSLAVDPRDDYLVFTNKRDGSLFLYGL